MASQATYQIASPSPVTTVDDEDPEMVFVQQIASPATVLSTEIGDHLPSPTPHHTTLARGKARMACEFRARRHHRLEATYDNVIRIGRLMLPLAQQSLKAKLQGDFRLLLAEVNQRAEERFGRGQYDITDLYTHFEAMKLVRLAQYENDKEATESIYSNTDMRRSFPNVYERLDYCTGIYLLVLGQISKGEQIDAGK
ncbi:hypothetical protein LTS08_008622 [Lithohypha guttulata]|uniref:uncharacterized protein n=1 Tax=Lithohypha guttulata TaxID=1690604 RepID=UPI002DE0B51F|nr:hypothetical protein LTS08_008622 [Lithohypha guttulata]